MNDTPTSKARGITVPALILAVMCIPPLADSTDDPSIDRAVSEWNRTLSSLPTDGGAEELETYRSKWGLPLPFWAGPGATPGSDGVLAVSDESPCGETTVALRETIPPADTEVLEAESILEIDGAGNVLVEWRAPHDMHVLAIRERELVVSVWVAPVGEPREGIVVRGRSVSLGILPNGEFRVVGDREESDSELTECPELERFSNSAYLRCWTFRDESDGSERLLAYQGPCT